MKNDEFNSFIVYHSPFIINYRMGFFKEIYYYFTSRVFWLNFLLASG